MLSLITWLWLSLVCALPTEVRYLRGTLETVVSGGLCVCASVTPSSTYPMYSQVNVTLLAMRALCVCMALTLSLAWMFLSFVSYLHQGLFVLLLCMYPSWPQTPASASRRLELQACFTMLGTARALFPLWAGPVAPHLGPGWSTHAIQPSGFSSGAAPLWPLVSSVSSPCSLLCCPFCPVVLKAEAGLFPWALCCGSHLTA